MAAQQLLSANLDGFRARKVMVEVDLSPGLSAFKIVGLPDQAVEEARERVSSALRNSNAKPPEHHNRRVTINLAPADVRKHGTWFDLPITLAFLLASRQIALHETLAGRTLLVVGELGLDGTVRPVHGVLAAAALARELQAIFIAPEENRAEAMLIPDLTLLSASALPQLIAALEKGEGSVKSSGSPPTYSDDASDFDFGFIRGQQQAKRTLEIAAAGNHHILILGAQYTRNSV